jgi:hypothetical protein
MPELHAEEQALAYLAEMSPSETFQTYPFDHGWVCTKVLTPEQIAQGQNLGAARLVIDSDTGIIYGYPSWPIDLIMEHHGEFKKTGVNRVARQIYPHQTRITLQRISEDDQAITYRMTVDWLTEPPKPSQQYDLTLDKRTNMYHPTSTMAAVAASRVRWIEQRDGTWPKTATTTV